MYLLDSAGGANLFGTGPQGRWQGKRLGLQGTGAGALGNLSVLELTPLQSMAPSVPASSAKGMMHCPGQWRTFAWAVGEFCGTTSIPTRKQALPEDGGECPRQIYLSPELNFLVSQKNVCFSRVWADVVIQLW